uniref:Uncharacterized protein n=1 Tax=Parascaris univalens TaxID=6257 RepID=A0A915APK2_PARUN
MSIGTPPTPLNVRSALLTERRVAETVALRSGASDQRDGGLQPNTPSRRRTLLTSKSLDDQVEENVREEIRGGSGALVASSGNTSRNVELQRARSIPAIIVGEIPTLVVTSSEATCSSSHQSPPSNPSNASYLAAKQNTDDTSDPRPLHGSTTGVSARRQGKQRDENSSSATRLMSQANRLLTTSSVSRSTERDSHSHLGVVSGSLQRRCRPGQHRSSHSSDEGHRYVHSPTGGLSGRRLLSVYILDLSHVLSEHFARWQEQDLQLNAPEDTILYSICVGRGEVIIFGGMRSDSTMEGLSPFTHSIN